MINGKKILIVTTVDSMIGCFLLGHIKQLQDAGNVVECACHETGFWFKEMQGNGIVVHEVPFARNPLHPRNLKAQKVLEKIVEEGKFDLIHCHTPVGGVMGRRVAKKFKIPCLYIAHGFHFFKGAPLVNQLIYKTIEKHYSKLTDALVTMNEEDYKAALKMKAKRVYKINGIGYDESKFELINESEKLALKNELGIQEGDVVIISVGELNANKNHIAVIKSLARLNLKNVKYFICGRGERKEEYENLIAKLGLKDNVKLLGYRRDINNILQISDIFIMPSLREGLPMSMLEAMNVGLPILAFNIRGCNDLVKSNENGFLVNPKEKYPFDAEILKLVKNAKLRDEFGKNGKKFAKTYNLSNVLSQMEQIYDQILN